jgi:FkbM family methyltransferase
MKQFQGIWMPSSEVELVDWMSKYGQIVDGKGTYQYAKFLGAMEHCKSFRRCIDQGSHIGLWTMQLAKRFDFVECFEPVAHLRECWMQNVLFIDRPGIMLRGHALGKEPGTVLMFSHKLACGDSSVEHAPEYMRKIYDDVARPVNDAVEMRTLDSFEFIDVDFIKLDAEGYEENIARGAAETIRKWRPVILVEQKRDMACKYGLQPQGALQYLEQAHDYRIAREMGGDFVMVPR